MLDKLLEILLILPELIAKPEVWDSLVINRRKPHTYRIFTKVDDWRVCLHKFKPCDTHESFRHPHPWPAAFMILEGKYKMWIGQSFNQTGKPIDVSQHIMTKYSSYEIVNPLTWHAITPLQETYTIMINGTAWDKEKIAHRDTVPMTGIDLDKMEPAELQEQLNLFAMLIANWRNNY